jgi:hypothetical protein
MGINRCDNQRFGNKVFLDEQGPKLVAWQVLSQVQVLVEWVIL